MNLHLVPSWFTLSGRSTLLSKLKLNTWIMSGNTVHLSWSVMSNSLWPHGLQHARPPCPSPTPRVYSNSCPLSRWCYPTISSSVVLFSSCLQSSQHQGLFQGISSSHQVAEVLEFQLQHQSFQWIFRTDFLYVWLVWSPYRLRDSQESSLTPQFKINSSALSFLYSPIPTFIHAAAAAKSLQLCLTQYDPTDSSPPGSPVPGILQARTLE